MKTALITGIAGQDGTYLAELLVGKGYRVAGVSRSARSRLTAPKGVDLFDVDVTNAAAVATIVAEAQPSAIYHLAAQSSVHQSFEFPVGTFEANALGTLNVLEAARNASSKPRVLVAASCEAFGDTGGEPAREDTPLRPLSPYSAAKAAAVHLARSYRASFGTYVSVAFLYNHESPLRMPHFVTKKIVTMACRIAKGLEPGLELGDISVVRDWGWAPEYMDAAWRALELESPEDFVLASGHSITLERFIEAAFARVGLQAKDHVTSTRKLFRPVDIPVMRADPARAKERLGWQATIFGAAVAERMVDAELAAQPGS